MTDKLTMIEIFSGIGAQERALRQLQIPYEVIATMDVDKDAILSYAASRCDFEKKLESYEFPLKEEMVYELQSKNVGYDFVKSKHSITMKTNVDKVKKYYLAHVLSHNLGDVSLLDKLPHVDIICHTSPCQDYSVAGKGAGGDEGSGTRSSLMYESLRLIETSKPKYVLWENVAAVLSAKHKHNFIKYLERLSELGYENMFDLLNAKNYGLPQNRLRIFCVSRKIDNLEFVDNTNISYHSENKQVQNVMDEIRNNPNIRIWKSFKFPDKIPLNIRLKDILEKNVDEKFYLPDDRIDKILNSTFMQEKKRIQMKDVCDTLLARDWKDPKCVQVEDPFIVASRGRNPDNPSDRTTGAPTEQRLEPNFSGCTNTLTSVQKDNYVAEPQVKNVGNIYPSNGQNGNIYDVDGISPTINAGVGIKGRGIGSNNAPKVIVPEPVIYDDYNSHISSDQDAINTLTTNCGASAERNGVKILEPIVCEERRDEGIRLFKDDCVGTLRTIDACGDKRVLEPEPRLVGGIGEKNFGKQYRQGNRVYDSDAIAMALNAQPVGNTGGYSYLYAVENEPEIIKEDVIFPVMVRKYDVDVENLKKLLREHKNYSNKEIAERLNVTLTQVEHWFRQDEYFAIPDADIWFELKNLLNITTNEFDESITTFEVKDGVYDKANRCYHIDGIAPTLTVASGNEKIFEPNNIKWRIRKLTTKECWRLMGFTDEDHDRAAEYVSASSLYKQAGNSICTCCLVAIFNALFLQDYNTSYAEKLVDYNS